MSAASSEEIRSFGGRLFSAFRTVLSQLRTIPGRESPQGHMRIRNMSFIKNNRSHANTTRSKSATMKRNDEDSESDGSFLDRVSLQSSSKTRTDDPLLTRSSHFRSDTIAGLVFPPFLIPPNVPHPAQRTRNRLSHSQVTKKRILHKQHLVSQAVDCTKSIY
jgi:hypothetical protein